MESWNFVYSVRSENANAISQYRHTQFTSIFKLLQFMEVFVAVALISWSSTRLPSVFKFSGEYLFVLTSYLMNQHVIFLVGNAIVLVCYVLSRYTDTGIHYDEYGDLDHFTHRKTVPEQSPDPEPVPSPMTEPPVEIENRKAIIKTVMESETETAVTAIKQAAKQIERFQRTQSELKSKISVKPHRELRRSMTEKTVASCDDQQSPVKSFHAVDKLSNEEFRLVVETFISERQRILKQQRMMIEG